MKLLAEVMGISLCLPLRHGMGELSEVVDINGVSLVSDVIMVGMPYLVPDKYSALIKEGTARRSRMSLWKYRNTKARVRILQTLERAIRCPSDIANWWFLIRDSHLRGEKARFRDEET